MDSSSPAPDTRLWRFLRFPLTRIVIATVAIVLIIGVIQFLGLKANIKPNTAPGAVIGVLIIAAVFATYIAYVRLIERRAVTELSTRKAGVELGAGAIVGAVLFGL